MDIAIIGFGGVSKALIKLLNDKKKYLYNLGTDIKVKYIIKSNGGIYNNLGINLKEIINNNYNLNIEDFEFKEDININTIIKNKDIDILVELTSTNIETGEPGLTHISLALKNSINVVTGNKGPILLQYNNLKRLADKNNVKLGIGCTTGGALPSINVGTFDIAGAEVLSIEGILNGTSNYILTEMYENEVDYSGALNKAICLGIAEANYKLDVEGYDTASKILILANVIMNSCLTIDDIEIEGISSLGKHLIINEKNKDNKIKLIGRVYKENNKIKAYVKPEIIDKSHPLYFVDGKNKGVLYKTDTLGDISVIGGASGTTNAAASILRDIININC
ncbi:homoserine dehydrogenase [Clostridium sp. 1001275B_160808_H3]|uniref:homoserine dehydrogenase n=1 Tax=Clostridium sp. 1001275B_160808_H3 TaxID=2787110 RepID=UPI00189963EB|nr:homoserine dehydrogenase [Clostridium sp. 1001275B_160808_H3]